MPRKLKLFLGIGFLLSLLCVSAHAGDDGVSAQVSVDRAVVLIGDRIRLGVDVQYRAGTRIDFPEFKDDRIGDFEIKDSGSEFRKGIFGGDLMRRWYYIAAYSAGKHQVPPIEIKYRKKGESRWTQLKTAELIFTVETVLPRGTKLTDVKDIKGVL